MTNRKQIRLVPALAILTLASLCQIILAGPGRAIIQNGTIKTADGKRLVGFGLVYAQRAPQSTKDWGKNINNLRRARDEAHYNCIRLCHIDTRLGAPPALVSSVFPEIDTLVSNLGQLGMYLIIDYHSMPLWDGSEWDMRHYWDVIAPRYKDVPWVMYDMTNEPTGSPPKDTNDWQMSWAKETYVNHMRKWAPNTMILHWSSTCIMDYWSPFLKNYAAALGFSWTGGKDVFAYHAYCSSTGQYILDLRTNGVPGICTEAGYWEDGFGPATLGGCTRQQEWFTRNDISHIDWVTTNKGWFDPPDPLDHAIRYMVPDALQKGYAWWTGTAVSPVADSRPLSGKSSGPEDRYYNILGRLVAPEAQRRKAATVLPVFKTGRQAGTLIFE